MRNNIELYVYHTEVLSKAILGYQM